MMQSWYYVESLTGQRHDRVQTESQELQPWTAVSTLLGLVSAVWQVKKKSLDIAKCWWWWPQMKFESKCFAGWPVSHAKRATKYNQRKNPEYHVVVAIRPRDCGQTRTVPQKISRPNHVKNEQHIGSKKTYSPKNTEPESSHNDAMKRKRKCSVVTLACLVAIFSHLSEENLNSFVSSLTRRVISWKHVPCSGCKKGEHSSLSNFWR